MKGWWESNISVWFRFMYSQKWNCTAPLFPKQYYNFLFLNFHILVSVSDLYIPMNVGGEAAQFSFLGIHQSDFRYSACMKLADSFSSLRVWKKILEYICDDRETPWTSTRWTGRSPCWTACTRWGRTLRRTPRQTSPWTTTLLEGSQRIYIRAKGWYHSESFSCWE